jgi:hypothetical protein
MAAEEAAMSEDRVAWLANLKPGDIVLVDTGYGMSKYEARSVVKITTTGKIRLSNDKLFRPDGIECGTPGWHNDRLVMPTRELRELIEARGIASELTYVNFYKLDLDQLRAIWAIVEGKA